MSETTSYKENMDTTITIRCKNCHTIVVDLAVAKPFFEEVEREGKSMGSEIIYEATIPEICNDCGENISITLKVWEYPVGEYKQEIVVVEGECIDECPLWPFVHRN